MLLLQPATATLNNQGYKALHPPPGRVAASCDDHTVGKLTVAADLLFAEPVDQVRGTIKSWIAVVRVWPFI